PPSSPLFPYTTLFRSNRIAGSWEQELLARLLSELQEVPDLDVSLSGFGEEAVAKLLKTLDARDKGERPETFDLNGALAAARVNTDRKSTRLNSSHVSI